MIKILEKLLSLIYTRECYFCGFSGDDALLCSRCQSKIHFMPKSILKNIDGVEVYCVALYDGIIKDMIKALKYKKQKQLAKVMADLIFQYWCKLSFNQDFLVLPVPIHKQRRKERKYNHMELVAKVFCSYSKYKYSFSFLLRIKDTKKQYNLNKIERIKNIKDAFDLNMSKSPDKSQPILIIDDITSTGVTLSEIIKVLHKNGFKNIKALALATPDIWN